MSRVLFLSLFVLQITLGSTQFFVAEAAMDPTHNGPLMHVPPRSDLAIAKSDSPDPVAPGGNITYTLQLTNSGPDPANMGVTLTDAIPAGTTFVSFAQTSGEGFLCTTPPIGGTGTVTCVRSNMNPGIATFTLVVNVNAPDGSVITNVVVVEAVAADPNLGNNTDTETTQVKTPSADLEVTKTDTPDPVTAGANLTYTLTLHNAGPSDAQNVMLSDAIPANTTFVSFAQTSGPAFTPTTPPPGGTGTVTATIATFASGATATFTLVVNVNANTPEGSTITNTVSVSSSTGDPELADNTDTETTSVGAAADLFVTKADDPDPVEAGTNLSYFIVAGNAGPSDAQNVTITDPIPTNTTFVSFTQTSGPAFTPTTPPVGGTGTVVAQIATFAAGATATFTLVVNVNASTPDGSSISNTVDIHSSTGDPNPANNTDTETTQVGAGADLSVTKDDSPPDFVGRDENITYTITVTNAGPSDAQNVTITDAIPANTTFVSFTQTSGPAFTITSLPPAGGTGTVTATSATFAAGATATFVLVVNVNDDAPDGAQISNTVNIQSTTGDPNPTSNSDTETTQVSAPET